MTLDVHTCPLCELRFAWLTELEDHLEHDHADRLQPGRFTTFRQPTATSSGTITVPLDPERPLAAAAVDTAAALARQGHLAVELVAVPSAEPSSATAAFLRVVARRMETCGVGGVRWRVLPEAPVSESLLGHLTESDTDLVCMSTRSSHATSELLFGSVASSVLRRSPVPVVLVGPHVASAPSVIDRVVVCLDGSDVAEHALDVTAAVAERIGAELFLVQVLEPGLSTGDVAETAYLHRQATRIGAQVAGYDVLHHRDPAHGIRTFLADTSTALVAMGTHGRTAGRHLVAGSVTSDVVRRSTCPVLAVPAGATPGRGHRRHAGTAVSAGSTA